MALNPTDCAAEKARKFLDICHQFQLGNLVTEAPHPRSRDLSRIAAENPAAALGVLFDVDRDVVEAYRSWAETGAAVRIGLEVAQRITDGGKLFFTGCGATGRLSIQLVALWREHWRQARERGECAAEQAVDLEGRALSVMAGGDFALIKSVEGFEDYASFGGQQLDELGLSQGDTVFAITEGGETSFVIGTAWKGVETQARVFFVYNNPDQILCETVTRSREIIEDSRIEKINLTTGPMAITGSTRMQATSIQLCAMMTILEVVLQELSKGITTSLAPKRPLEKISGHFFAGLDEVQRALAGADVGDQLARLVLQEEQVYRAGARNNYFANHLAIDVLTDTTERSPTFCIPAFKKHGDPDAAESWSYLFLPYDDSHSAWRALLKRELQPVAWTKEKIRALIGEEDLDHQCQMMRRISHDEILRFRIGLDGLADRQTRPGDSAAAFLLECECNQLTEQSGFYRRQLEQAHDAGGATAVIFFGSAGALEQVRQFLANWRVPALQVLVPLPEDHSKLQGSSRIAAKMLLNALSTLTMVRLGRVLGNVMIWVVPSNLKLIDRATRYICHFTGLDYPSACHLLHQAIEYNAPRMRAGREYPSAVALSVLVNRDQCTFEEAEQKLAQGDLDSFLSPQ